jgi:hypothetical protein
MALGTILGVIGTAAKGAYNAYKVAEEKKKKTTTQPTQTNNNPTIADHQAYINQTHPGGMDAYTKLQQERLYGAYATGDQDLINRLNQQQPVLQNPYEDYLNQIEDRYSAINKQIENANQAAIKQGTNRLQSQIPMLNQGYDDAARQAYIMSMQARKAMPQQLAVQGATGGATETAMLGLDTAYQNNLNQINTQRQNSLTDINNSIVDLQNSGDLATAEQILGNNQNALNAYQNMLNNSASYQQWLANYNVNRSDTQWNRDYQVGRDNINDLRYDNENSNALKQQEYNNILNRLGMGLISPDDAVALGVSAQDVQAFVDRIIAAQNAELANTNSLINKRSGTGNNADVNNENPVLSTADKYLGQGNRQKAIEALASIYTNEQIKQYLESKGYRTDDIDWGIEPTNTPLPNRSPNILPTSVLSIEKIAAFLKSQGLSNEEIAERLNRNQ